jgi:hypothetical protein
MNTKTNFVVSNSLFSNALNRVSNLTDESNLAHGVVEQLLHKNLNRLEMVQANLVTKDGKANALQRKINAYLKHLGFKVSKTKQGKQGKLKVKNWLDEGSLITFTEFLSLEKEALKASKPLEDRLLSLLSREKEANLADKLAILEGVKAALIAAEVERLPDADIDGKKKTKAA